MAKLDNVKVIEAVAASIEVGGVKYVESGEDAAAGDIVRSDEHYSFLPRGAFYLAFLDEDGGVSVTDEDGDISRVDDEYTVFKRVETKSTPKRLTVGDYAKVVGNTCVHNYVIGSVIKLVRVGGGNSDGFHAERTDGSIGNVIRECEGEIERATESEFIAHRTPPTAALPVEPAIPTSLPDQYVIHDGRVYVKEAREAKAGELVIVTDTSGHWIKLGEVVVAESSRMIRGEKAQFSDAKYRTEEYAQTQSVNASNYRVLVPTDSVTIGGAGYTLESRKANVGETVLVVVDNSPWYAASDIVKLDVKAEVRDNGHINYANGTTGMSAGKYVVLAPKQAAPATPQYREVKRAVNVGERIRIVNKAGSEGRYENGAEGIVTKPWGLPDVKADINGRVVGVLGSEYVVLEEIAQETEKAIRQIAVGDSVRITVAESKDTNSGRAGVKNSEVGKVTEVSGNRVTVTWPSFGSGWGGVASELEVVAETPQPKRLAVGDYAKVISLTLIDGGTRKDASIGEIFEIIQDGRCCVPFRGKRLSDGFITWFRVESLVRATDEEVAEAKAKLAERAEAAALTAKWAAIGRKVNEYKAGDLVQFTESTGADDYRNGSFAVLVSVKGSRFTFGDNGKYNGNASWCVLVTPVEQRFDRNEVAKSSAA